jgi:hypothetical protein
MRTLATFVLALAAAAGVRAQSAPDEDSAGWTAEIARQVPAEELGSALTAKLAAGGVDPLLAVAARHRLAAPAWLLSRVREQGGTATLAALGDSVSAGSYSCSSFYCASNSWSTGDIDGSVRRRLEAQSGRTVRGLLFAVPGVEIDALPAEAYAVYLASAFGLDVQRMTLLIGHNDPGVCRPDKPGEEDRFERNVSLALDILGRVARKRGAKLFVGGLLEADALTAYADVVPQGAASACRALWESTGRCADLLQRRDEPARLAEARARIADDDATLRRLSAGRDWVLYSGAFTATSRGGVPNPAVDLSRYDCFHPSPAGQAGLADAAWNGGGGEPGISGFFALGAPGETELGSSGLRSPAPFPDGLSRYVDAWARETASAAP